MAKSIMIQGAGSNVGKSLIVAGLCRAFANRGLTVRPFKPQNMSNNAAVTVDGGEIGRAQALQALASNVAAHTDMNPVLLKPESDTGSQVIVQGKRLTTVKAHDYTKMKPQLIPAVLESFNRLQTQSDLVIIEGAGSPAEINLRAGDIANMGFAEAADVPVVLVGDIERGGVIAQLIGTSAVLPPNDRERIKGFIVNKFRGDPTLFIEGQKNISDITGWADLGVLPWFPRAGHLPAEDVIDIKSTSGGYLKIAVPRLSRIANFDDLDPLSQEPGVSVEIIEEGRPLPGNADLVLIPGTKSTIADLKYFRAQGWDIDLKAHIRRGGHVLGVCGGYQMLGNLIRDPEGIEGSNEEIAGLGHLDVVTDMSPEKRLAEVAGRDLIWDTPVSGYEIHIGKTGGPDCKSPWLTIEGQPHGAQSPGGQVLGCYLHGIFTGDAFRAAYLDSLGGEASGGSYGHEVEAALNGLAEHLEKYLDLNQILELAD